MSFKEVVKEDSSLSNTKTEVIQESNSVEKLKLAFYEAVEDYLELCKMNNKQPQKVYKVSFNIRISPDLHCKAVREATIKRVSLNQFIESAIKEKVLTSK